MTRATCRFSAEPAVVRCQQWDSDGRGSWITIANTFEEFVGLIGIGD